MIAQKLATGTFSYALVFFALCGCSPAPEPPLRLGTLVSTTSEIPYLARDLGYYDAISIDFVRYQSPAEMFRAYRNGLIDVLPLSAEYFLQLTESDPIHRVVLVTGISNGADAILARPDCPGLGESEMCTIGLEGSAAGAYMLKRAIDHHEMTMEHVRTRFVDVPDQEEAYLSGDVDIVVTSEPTRTKLLNRGAKELFNSSEIPNEIVGVLVARKELLQARPDELRTVVQGWLRAQDYLAEHPDDAAARVARLEGISPRQYQESLSRVTLLDKETNLAMLGGDAPTLDEILFGLSATMLDAGMLSGPVNCKGLLTANMLEEQVR